MEILIMIMQIQHGDLIFLGIIFLGVLLWIFWPGKGGLSRFEKIKKNNQKVLLEDALKFLFDCEYRSNSCNLKNLSGNLKIPTDKTRHILDKLLTMGLISINEQAISLTDTGRSYALRIIRVHRIWERYLADETSVAQVEWHNEADKLEHFVTHEETEKIAAQMGHPAFDPHGDPIPSAEGEMPAPNGISLSRMKEGQIGRIIHMEDEPKSIYEQLTVEGLYPGMQVYVTDVADNKITFAADGDECVLTPLFADHITVEVLTEKEPVSQKYELLSSLGIGEQAEVVGISPNCRGQQRRRLMDMGIVPGSFISAVIKSASGDPVGYRVLGTTVGIRVREADMIFINRKNN